MEKVIFAAFTAFMLLTGCTESTADENDWPDAPTAGKAGGDSSVPGSDSETLSHTGGSAGDTGGAGGSDLDAQTHDTNASGGNEQDSQPPDGAILDSATDTASATWVKFTQPADGATVSNPVTFRIQASGVDQVEVFADTSYSLGAAWDPSERDTLLYRFAGTGIPRPIRVVGRKKGVDTTHQDITITVKADSCEDLFFVQKFDANNKDTTSTLDMVGIRESSLAALKVAVEEMKECGAKLTLGGMMSLLLYEGAFRVGAYNTKCIENSYNKTASDCDIVAEALYSYQFGLGALHTSNLHPCKGGSYTQGMRQAFLDAAKDAGFSVDPSLMNEELTKRFRQVCSTATPSAVDYYILGAHSVFNIPRNTAGNFLQGYGKFPLFTPSMSIRLMFRALRLSCSSIGSDRDAIRIYGGADTSYGTTAKQDQILSYYNSFAATNCK